MLPAGEHGPYGPGDRIAGTPYVIEGALGAGGAAVVYAAVDSSCGRPIVVKVLRPEVAARGRMDAAQMEREARTLVALQQRTENVVEVFTAGVTADALALPYYVMERLSGHTLRAALERRQAARALLAIDEAIGIAVDLGGALEAAHGLGVVHLDVKPENAFVHRRRDGAFVMKLLDFGVSAARDRTLGFFRGTYRYAAPEQIRGQRVSPATDLYALGLVLFEALTLRHAFDAPTPEALAHAQCQAPAPFLGSLRPDAPPDLARIVAACLAKRPEDRPPSAGALAAELRDVRARFERRIAGATSYLAALTLLDVPSFATDAPAPAAPAVSPAARSEVFFAALPAAPAPPIDPSQIVFPAVPSSTLRGTGRGPSNARGRRRVIVAAIAVAVAIAIAGAALLTLWSPGGARRHRAPKEQAPRSGVAARQVRCALRAVGPPSAGPQVRCALRAVGPPSAGPQVRCALRAVGPPSAGPQLQAGA